jgi:NitT/TauT family transport system substrate-binding protein
MDKNSWQRCTITTASSVGIACVAGLLLTSGPRAVAATAGGSTTKLTISYSEKVGDDIALWIAVDAGYFEKHGLDVTAIFLPAQEGIPALLTGQVQMAAIGGSDAISAAAQGVKLKFVANFSPVYTFQFWARPQYANAAALKGQRVGVSSTTGSLYTATLLALKQLGLAPSDVSVTPLGTVPNVDSALLSGSIAAAASHPPATYRYQQQGFVDLVDLAQKRIPNINTGLVAPDSFIAAHPKTVGAAVAAIVEALHREKSDRAYTESEIRKHMGIKDPAVLDFTYNFYANEVAPSLPMPEANELAVAKQALSVNNAKVKAVDLTSLIDQDFVKAAAVQPNTK